MQNVHMDLFTNKIDKNISMFNSKCVVVNACEIY